MLVFPTNPPPPGPTTLLPWRATEHTQMRNGRMGSFVPEGGGFHIIPPPVAADPEVAL